MRILKEFYYTEDLREHEVTLRRRVSNWEYTVLDQVVSGRYTVIYEGDQLVDAEWHFNNHVNQINKNTYSLLRDLANYANNPLFGRF